MHRNQESPDVVPGFICVQWLELRLTFVWQAFGQSFLHPDIHIFKQNLSYLEILNTKHKLYHRVRNARFVSLFS